MPRLQSTKAIFNGKLQTTYRLMARTNAQVTQDYHKLNRIRGSILRATRPKTLESIRVRLEALALEMGHIPPKHATRNAMLSKISTYKRQNSYLGYASLQQGLINMCVIYEELIRRIILKHYEESIYRIPSQKQSIPNHVLIEAIVRGDNMHRALAERAVEDIMYGSVESWHKTLNGFGMNIVSSGRVGELFLIRNCVVHNQKRVSILLNKANPSKFPLRSDIRFNLGDMKQYRDDLHKLVLFITSEYDRIHPKNLGTWLGINT